MVFSVLGGRCLGFPGVSARWTWKGGGRRRRGQESKLVYRVVLPFPDSFALPWLPLLGNGDWVWPLVAGVAQGNRQATVQSITHKRLLNAV